MNITLFINSKEQRRFHELIDPIALETISKERKERYLLGFDIRNCGYCLKVRKHSLGAHSEYHDEKRVDRRGLYNEHGMRIGLFVNAR